MIKIRNGAIIPIAGEPRQEIQEAPLVRTVALVGDDYLGMRPTMAVEEGQSVKQGQLLFSDKKTPGVRYTSPASGRVAAVNRGAKRVFQSIVIEVEGDEHEAFQSFADEDLSALGRERARDHLVESGLWTALRTRPLSKVPPIEAMPHSLFVTAIDTNPLAPRPETVMAGRETDFVYGLQILRHLTEGKLFLCKAAGAEIPGADLDFVTVEEFDGPHPAGLPGTHIHFLDPVNEKKTVWYINYQDVLAIGRFFVTGRLPVERVISLAGPAVKEPRLLRTRLGANIRELVEGQLNEGDNRVVSGPVLCGRAAVEPFHFLGRHHLQVSALPEGRERVFLGWQDPGFSKYSVTRAFAYAFFGKGRKLPFTTSMEGSKRAMVPIGTYEKVMPLDLVATYLLRSLIIGDTEQAQSLGCLELDEEDLALCTFVCPGKYEYGPLLRKTLTTIEREG